MSVKAEYVTQQHNPPFTTRRMNKGESSRSLCIPLPHTTRRSIAAPRVSLTPAPKGALSHLTNTAHATLHPNFMRANALVSQPGANWRHNLSPRREESMLHCDKLSIFNSSATLQLLIVLQSHSTEGRQSLVSFRGDIFTFGPLHCEALMSSELLKNI